MADISAAIRALALSVNSVSSIIGTRMYSDVLISNATVPALVYLVVDTVPNESLVGVVDVMKARVQFDAYANTRSAANELADYLRQGIQKFRGQASAHFINEINLATGEVHNYDKDGPFYITTQDFFVTYRL